MADLAKRLVGPLQLSGAAATVYTVPADTTTALREMIFANTSAAIVNVTVSIGADAPGTRIVPGLPVPANGFLRLIGWTVLHTANPLQAYASAAGAITLTASGVEIT